MAKGYWVGRVDVIKPEGYQAYGVALAEVLRKYGAKFLVRGGTFEAVEGKARARNIVLEFKDHATALACYRSPEYAKAKGITRGAVDIDIIRDRRLRRAAADGLIASPARPFGVGPRRGPPPTSVRPPWLAASSLLNRRWAA